MNISIKDVYLLKGERFDPLAVRASDERGRDVSAGLRLLAHNVNCAEKGIYTAMYCLDQAEGYTAAARVYVGYKRAESLADMAMRLAGSHISLCGTLERMPERKRQEAERLLEMEEEIAESLGILIAAAEN